MKKNDFSLRLGDYLGNFLPAQRNVSANTIASYSQTFVLFLEHCQQRGTPANRLTLDDFTADAVLDFLQHLERERGNGFSTRNQRLAALRSFTRYLESREPGKSMQWKRLLSLRRKKGRQRTEIAHMEIAGMASLLRAPDRTTPWGRRDTALLSLLYDTGMRVQELADINLDSLRFDHPAHVKVRGKGRKERLLPLLPATVNLLNAYVDEWFEGDRRIQNVPLFFNHRRERLTRSGIRWIIVKYVERCGAKNTEGKTKISPHTFRHSKAMHLMQSGASLAEVQSLLGHSDVSTTLVYARADFAMVCRALEGAKIEELPAMRNLEQRPDELLTWLKKRCRPSS